MTTQFADRVERVEPSATLAISNLAAELEADGVDVVDLSVGEPDFPTPETVAEAGKRAIDDGHTDYAPSNGVPALKEAIADKLAADGLPYVADAAAKGLTDVSLERDTPVTFGVTGPEMSVAEADERVDKGAAAVESAIALAEELQ